jgi:tripartite-type tricarboxylate transporter receptor subunit TctC
MLGALTSHSTNMTLQKNPGYDLRKDFAPIGLAGNVGLVLVVNPPVPAKTVPELVALIKAKPDDYAFASSGVGSPQHLSGELFNLKAGTKMPMVSYRGSGPLLTDLLAGQLKFSFDTIPAALQHVKAGSLRAIATTGREVSPFMPEVPTAISQGLGDFEVSSWFGLLAPAGTPQPVLDKLNAELNEALQSPKLKEAFALQGVVPKPGTPADAAKLIDSEIAKWGELIKVAGIKTE